MTSVPTTMSGGLPAARPTAIAASQASPAPSAMGGSIDPIKLVNKYKWLLAGAAVLGGVVGVGSHFLLLNLAPLWTPKAILKCLPAPSGDIVQNINLTSDIELSRFIQTQARIMTGDAVLQRLAESSQLRDQAKVWCKQFYKLDPNSGQEVFNTKAALEKLRDTVKARVIPQTSLMELSVAWRDRDDSTTVCRLVTDQYIKLITDESDDITRNMTKAFRDTIESVDKTMTQLKNKRESLIKDEKVQSIDDARSQQAIELQAVKEVLLEKTQSREGLLKQLVPLQEMNDKGDIVPPDDMLEEADRDPQVQESRSRVRLIETQRQMLINRGLSPDHRECRQNEVELKAARATSDEAQRRVVSKIFQGKLQQLQTGKSALEAQIEDLTTKQNKISARLIELTAIQTQLTDIARQMEGLQKQKEDNELGMRKTLATGDLPGARRVIVQDPARSPTEMTFPQIKLLAPAGMMLMVLLVGGTALVRELIDQRIKNPSDIAIIPRTRLLGWVPDAIEDPAGEGSVETAFRDRSRGIVAESFRQLRSSLNKRMQQAGHKTVLVLSGLPASGATSTVANLAMAYAAADRKVLVIDANFRRPGVHRVFGVAESPGLADVLGKQADYSACVQASGTANLDVMTAGSKEQRVLERLSTEAMGEVLAQARGTYDIVLIDVAPAIVAGDGLALAHRVDATALVVRAFGEKRGMVARIKNDLMDTRSEFLGVIVNGVRASSGGYMKGNIKAAHEYQNA